MEGLNDPYHARASWVVSRQLYSLIQESNNNGLNFDPRTGLTTLFGYGLRVSDALEAPSAGNLVGTFGDYGMGVALGTAADMTIGRYDQTRPGAMTYFGHARFKHSVWDESAIIRFTVGA